MNDIRVKMPHEAGLPANGDTKDFSGHEYDKFKRYRTEDLKRNNMKKIIHPTSTIHIGGIQVKMKISHQSIFNMIHAGWQVTK